MRAEPRCYLHRATMFVNCDRLWQSCLAISSISSTTQHSFVKNFQEAFLNFANHYDFINFSWGTDGTEVFQAQNEHGISTLSTLSLTCRGFSSPKSISSQYNFSASHGKMSIASAQRNSFVALSSFSNCHQNNLLEFLHKKLKLSCRNTNQIFVLKSGWGHLQNLPAVAVNANYSRHKEGTVSCGHTSDVEKNEPRLMASSHVGISLCMVLLVPSTVARVD